MADLGFILLVLSLVLSVYAVCVSIAGVKLGQHVFVTSGRYATFAVCGLLVLSTLVLVSLFVTHDFSVAYVAAHSNLAMESQFIWVAFYSGNEGSLLFIATALGVLSSMALVFHFNIDRTVLTYANVLNMLVLCFFVGIMIFLANPFQTLDFIPADGEGINPLLTHYGMFIHPPVMMTGLICVTIPFSFAMGALIAGKTGDEWIKNSRWWGLIAWCLLGCGLLLGGWWAYTILGWGGYWAWDPVENSGFMPWLGLTAFLHSIMVQARRGMFRSWNVVLIICAFVLACFGMFINRGGPVPSVHSFGASNLGWMFLIFLGVVSLASLGLFAYRYSTLNSSNNLQSALSREAAFLANNLLHLFIAFVTLWGVVFPLISEIFQGETVTVVAPYYNKINGPAFLVLIFLMAIGPQLSWRHGSFRSLGRSMIFPLAAFITTFVLLLILGVWNLYAVVSYSLCAMVTASIVHEWWKGTRVRHLHGEFYVTAFIRLISSNKPRYGGYVVHLAIVMLALGVTGSSFFKQQIDVVLNQGDTVQIDQYSVEYVGIRENATTDRIAREVFLAISDQKNDLGMVKAVYDYYPAFRMASTKSGLRSTPIEDLYIIPSEFFDDGSVGFRININPMVWWIWISGPFLILGTLITLWPRESIPQVSARET